jgi:DNA-binding NarL/FixJ family response regulator
LLLALQVDNAEHSTKVLHAFHAFSAQNSPELRSSVLTSEQICSSAIFGANFVYRAGMEKRLNEREARICKYVAAGYSNRQIASRLRLSEQTVKNYLGQIFRKVGIDNRVQLAILSSALTNRKGKRRNPLLRMVPKPKRAKAS